MDEIIKKEIEETEKLIEKTLEKIKRELDFNYKIEDLLKYSSYTIYKEKKPGRYRILGYFMDENGKQNKENLFVINKKQAEKLKEEGGLETIKDLFNFLFKGLKYIKKLKNLKKEKEDIIDSAKNLRLIKKRD